MKRRSALIGAIGAAASAFGFGVAWAEHGGNITSQAGTPTPTPTPEPEAVEPEDAPSKVEASFPLASDLYRRVDGSYTASKVSIRPDGSIVMVYETQVETSAALKSEFHEIADVYAQVVADGGHEPRKLTVRTQEVAVNIAAPAVLRYNDGTINQDAFNETVEVTGVERA